MAASVIVMMAVAMIVVMVPVFMGVSMTVSMIGVGADARDMKMMSDLGLSDRCFVADDLLAILAKLTIHIAVAAQDFVDPLGESIEYERVIL